ncbi:MAG: hypothetical protein PHW24_01065 [Candidatus Moranbacteria bacterium]|nr:hypothetical protein [Candidatus Moranbacteria bacterium]
MRNDKRFTTEFTQIDLIKKWIARAAIENGHSEKDVKEYLNEFLSFSNTKDLLAMIESDYDDEYKIGYVSEYVKGMIEDKEAFFRERKEERIRLDLFIDKILESSEGLFKNKHEVLEVFLRAQLSGRLLPLARMIEKSFGNGSFRDVAKEFAQFKDPQQEAEYWLMKKRQKEKNDLEQRQRERIGKLEEMEKEGKLYVHE